MRKSKRDSSLHTSRLRVSFVSKELEDREGYVHDLETALLLNKQVIHDLCASSKQEGDRAAVSQLNEESKLLHERIKQLRKQQIEAEGIALINSQLVQEYQMREQLAETEYQHRLKDLSEQLNQQHCELRAAHSKLSIAESILRRTQKNPTEGGSSPSRIPYIVVDKERFRRLIEDNKTLTAEKLALEDKVAKLQATLTQGTNQLKSLNTTIHTLAARNTCLQRQLDHSFHCPCIWFVECTLSI